MSFDIIYDMNVRSDEFFFLMKKSFSYEEDEFGFGKEKYFEEKEIHGIIQRSQNQEIGFKGEESNPHFTGYFLPEFILKTSEVEKYRIRYIRPHETLILKIQDYNQNLFLEGKRDHIRLELILEKKYKGDS